MKRLLGQHKAGFGDLILDDVVKENNTLIVTAHTWPRPPRSCTRARPRRAATKLWGRRLVLDPLFAAAGVGGASVAVYFLYSFLREANEE